jgi:hypothetical protein
MNFVHAMPFIVVTPAKAGVCPGLGMGDEPQAWMDPGLCRDDGCFELSSCGHDGIEAGGCAMSRSLSSAQLSSWALCPGSISTLASGASVCGTMDPRDKPWDDSEGNCRLGWMAAFAAMTELVAEVAR